MQWLIQEFAEGGLAKFRSQPNSTWCRWNSCKLPQWGLGEAPATVYCTNDFGAFQNCFGMHGGYYTHVRDGLNINHNSGLQPNFGEEVQLVWYNQILFAVGLPLDPSWNQLVIKGCAVISSTGYGAEAHSGSHDMVLNSSEKSWSKPESRA